MPHLHVLGTMTSALVDRRNPLSVWCFFYEAIAMIAEGLNAVTVVFRSCLQSFVRFFSFACLLVCWRRRRRRRHHHCSRPLALRSSGSGIGYESN